MKIGIITFWWSQTNYGQVLQCYALQKYLRNAGHDAYLIRYNFETEVTAVPLWKKAYRALNPYKLYSFITERISSRKAEKEQSSHDRSFDEFREQYIIQSQNSYPTYRSLLADPPKADVYITGSDQIWNPDCLGSEKSRYFNEVINAYFLNFGTARRMSYAASWGVSSISESYSRQVKDLLSKFNFISVREKSGVQICSDLGVPHAQFVCDPTLLLDAQDYRKLYQAKNIPQRKEPYILAYLLKNTNSFNMDSLYSYAEKRNLKVVYVTGNHSMDQREKEFPSIEEWLQLIDNAEYVVTNSFHGSVFSTIFHKQFGIIPLTAGHASMNERFQSLFTWAGIEGRFIESDSLSILDEPYNPAIEKSDVLLDMIEQEK